MVRRESGLCQHAVCVCVIRSWEIVCVFMCVSLCFFLFFFPCEEVSWSAVWKWKLSVCELASPSRTARSALCHQDIQNENNRPALLFYTDQVVGLFEWLDIDSRAQINPSYSRIISAKRWNLATWHRFYPDLQPGVVVFPPRTASLIYAHPDVSQSRRRHHLVLGVIWGSLTELEVGTAERNMT